MTKLRIKRDKLDILFSQYMRLKAKGICERCHQPVGFKKLQVSHLFGRRYKATRWSERNCSVVCFKCHLEFHESPVEHVAWFIRERGQREYDLLLAETRGKSKDIDRSGLEIYYRAKINEV